MSKKIVIYTRDREVIAKIIENGKDICQASAKCHADDKFDFYTGAKLAVNRLEREYKKSKQDILTQKKVFKEFVNGDIDICIRDYEIDEFADELYDLYLTDDPSWSLDRIYFKLSLFRGASQYNDRTLYVKMSKSIIKHFEASNTPGYNRQYWTYEFISSLPVE